MMPSSHYSFSVEITEPLCTFPLQLKDNCLYIQSLSRLYAHHINPSEPFCSFQVGFPEGSGTGFHHIEGYGTCCIDSAGMMHRLRGETFCACFDGIYKDINNIVSSWYLPSVSYWCAYTDTGDLAVMSLDASKAGNVCIWNEVPVEQYIANQVVKCCADDSHLYVLDASGSIHSFDPLDTSFKLVAGGATKFFNLRHPLSFCADDALIVLRSDLDRKHVFAAGNDTLSGTQLSEVSPLVNVSNEPFTGPDVSGKLSTDVHAYYLSAGTETMVLKVLATRPVDHLQAAHGSENFGGATAQRWAVIAQRGALLFGSGKETGFSDDFQVSAIVELTATETPYDCVANTDFVALLISDVDRRTFRVCILSCASDVPESTSVPAHLISADDYRWNESLHLFTSKYVHCGSRSLRNTAICVGSSERREETVLALDSAGMESACDTSEQFAEVANADTEVIESQIMTKQKELDDLTASVSKMEKSLASLKKVSRVHETLIDLSASVVDANPTLGLNDLLQCVSNAVLSASENPKRYMAKRKSTARQSATQVVNRSRRESAGGAKKVLRTRSTVEGVSAPKATGKQPDGLTAPRSGSSTAHSSRNGSHAASPSSSPKRSPVSDSVNGSSS